MRPDDYGILYEIALFTDAGSKWRLHGSTPTMEQFLQILFQDARATFVVQSNEQGHIIGIVQLWNHEMMSRNGHITAFLDPAARGKGWPLEAILLLVEYAFAVFGLHKLYFETLATELSQYGSIVGPVLKEEGVLRDHRWVFGRLVDCHILALYADDVPKLLRLLPRPVDASEPADSHRRLQTTEANLPSVDITY